MNINYHYYMVKTLARAAGFEEGQAQTVAYYSQQVDDFTMHSPICVDEEPPAFFMEHGYAKKMSDSLWLVLPHPTGIDIAQSLVKNYRHTTLAPFHFIPGRTFQEIEDAESSRAYYRCIPACEEDAGLVRQVVSEAVDAVRKNRDEAGLMQLGMALHTYADTYAHCGFSGLEGWENTAEIESAYNVNAKKEEMPQIERLALQILPHIGHGNAGTAPDLSACKILLKTRTAEDDKKLSGRISRDNREWFLKCAREILDILCACLGQEPFADSAWQELSEKLVEPMQLSADGEKKKRELAGEWSRYFPNVGYSYKKNERFFEQEEDSGGDGENGLCRHVAEAFYTYNMLAYQRAALILGTEKRLMERTSLLDDAQLQLTQPQEESHEPGVQVERNMAAGADGHWQPETELGAAVFAAGFEYDAKDDMVCDAKENAPGAGEYRSAYDESAPALFSVADCEPVYFYYGAYEWVLVLRKGQYGVKAGCEAGLYYRNRTEPETDEEKELGKRYQRVADRDMPEMAFSLRKGGQAFLSRDWTRHWQAMGFRWGIFSEPEELAMSVSVRFPGHDMQQAFLHGGNDVGDAGTHSHGLLALGYDCTEPDDASVQFLFDKPRTRQPQMRDKARSTIQSANRETACEYRRICARYHAACNDPNVIGRMLSGQDGAAERVLYEKLVGYYRRMREARDFARNHLK